MSLLAIRVSTLDIGAIVMYWLSGLTKIVVAFGRYLCRDLEIRGIGGGPGAAGHIPVLRGRSTSETSAIILTGISAKNRYEGEFGRTEQDSVFPMDPVS